MRRSGFTLIEMIVAFSIASVFMVIGWQAIVVLEKGRHSTDQQASRTLRQSLVLETILRDMRSATGVEQLGEGEYAITRFLPDEDGRLVESLVIWRRDETRTRLLREVDAGPARVYDFTDVLEEGELLELRLEEVPDVLFLPE